MLKWLWRLFWPKDCCHEWQLLQKTSIYDVDTEIEYRSENPSQYEWLFRCTNCGKSKKYKSG